MRVWGQFAWGLVCRTLGILGSVALFGLVSAEVWDAGVRSSGFSRWVPGEDYSQCYCSCRITAMRGCGRYSVGISEEALQL